MVEHELSKVGVVDWRNLGELVAVVEDVLDKGAVKGGRREGAAGGLAVLDDGRVPYHDGVFDGGAKERKGGGGRRGDNESLLKKKRKGFSNLRDLRRQRADSTFREPRMSSPRADMSR